MDNVTPGQCSWKVGMSMGMDKDHHLVPSLPLFRDTDYKFIQGGLGPRQPIPYQKGD